MIKAKRPDSSGDQAFLNGNNFAGNCFKLSELL